MLYGDLVEMTLAEAMLPHLSAVLALCFVAVELCGVQRVSKHEHLQSDTHDSFK